MTAYSVLLVDDDASFRERLGRALRARGFEVWVAGSVAEASPLLEQESPEFALVDLRMPGDSGLELLKQLRVQDAATRAFVLTGYGSIGTAVDATRLGACGYLQKPLDAEDVVAALLGAPSAELTETPSLARVEWEHIQRVLADCEGNISEASRRLGVHRRSLQRKLMKFAPRR